MASILKKTEQNKAEAEITKLVGEITGIEFTSKNDAMIRSRLSRRLIKLGISEMSDYLDYLHKNKASETQELVNLLTTHHTRFFREFSHFEFLKQHALPKIIASMRSKGEKKLRVWSAACSGGQEVYSLAMFLKIHLKEYGTDLDFEILGTDIDSSSIANAKNGVYKWNEIKEIPSIYLASSWAKGTGDISEFVKAKANIKDHCKFEIRNLMELSKVSHNENYHFIFCRNVFIYFSQHQVSNITNQLLKKLDQNGYLFIGTSETLDKDACEVSYEAPSVYSHKKLKHSSTDNSNIVHLKEIKRTIETKVKKLIRVLCVDDSSTILSLLKKILSKEEGFEIVATASNGEEAAKIAERTAFDVMTLDLHMPKVGGIDYLRNYYKPSHPPIVIVSSVSRENKELGIESIRLGAKDYVEKPSLSDLKERGEEIRNKLKTATLFTNNTIPSLINDEITKSFSKDGKQKLRYANTNLLVLGQSKSDHIVNEQLELLKEKGINVYKFTNAKTSPLPTLGTNDTNILYFAGELDDNAHTVIKNKKYHFSYTVLDDSKWTTHINSYIEAKAKASHILPPSSFAFHVLDYLRNLKS